LVPLTLALTVFPSLLYWLAQVWHPLAFLVVVELF
jgi:hypothetical protein